jgi:hypothetical protein
LQSENKKKDYFFKRTFIKTDTTTYSLPANYIAESIPQPSLLKCDYGFFTTNYTYVKEKNQLISVARLELSQNRIPSDKYAEVKKVF